MEKVDVLKTLESRDTLQTCSSKQARTQCGICIFECIRLVEKLRSWYKTVDIRHLKHRFNRIHFRMLHHAPLTLKTRAYRGVPRWHPIIPESPHISKPPHRFGNVIRPAHVDSSSISPFMPLCLKFTHLHATILHVPRQTLNGGGDSLCRLYAAALVTHTCQRQKVVC
jgi:hypothetical protein